MDEFDPNGDLVLIRTEAGQHAAFDDFVLDVAGRRLLLLVNGYTPLSGLASRLDPREDWNAAASVLLQRRLVRRHPGVSVDHQRDLSPATGDKPVESRP
ncbi:MAG: hypothetical protein ABJD97_05685 [Betaproteobacteria bacterium]